MNRVMSQHSKMYTFPLYAHYHEVKQLVVDALFVSALVPFYYTL